MIDRKCAVFRCNLIVRINVILNVDRYGIISDILSGFTAQGIYGGNTIFRKAFNGCRQFGIRRSIIIKYLILRVCSNPDGLLRNLERTVFGRNLIVLIVRSDKNGNLILSDILAADTFHAVRNRIIANQTGNRCGKLRIGIRIIIVFLRLIYRSYRYRGLRNGKGSGVRIEGIVRIIIRNHKNVYLIISCVLTCFTG